MNNSRSVEERCEYQPANSEILFDGRTFYPLVFGANFVDTIEENISKNDLLERTSFDSIIHYSNEQIAQLPTAPLNCEKSIQKGASIKIRNKVRKRLSREMPHNDSEYILQSSPNQLSCKKSSK